MNLEVVRWGVIGTGNVTEVKSGPGLYKSRGSELVGVYNRTYEKAVSWAKRHNVDKVYKSVDEMLEDSEIDIVYIATPPNSHYKYAVEVLNAGKIPYIEKPIATTYKECLKIEKLSKEKGIPVYAAFYRRGMEKFLKIKEMLAEGVIGDIRQVVVSQTQQVRENELQRETLPWRVIPEISGGGKFLDIGVHLLDCLIMYFGEITSMTGIVENKGGYYDAEDTVTATFKFENGVIGVGNWCFVADKSENKVEIIGSKGRMIYDGLSAKKVVIERGGKSEVLIFDVPEHAAMPLEQAIVDELRGIKKSEANFSQSINTVKVTEELLKDYREKQNYKIVE